MAKQTNDDIFFAHTPARPWSLTPDELLRDGVSAEDVKGHAWGEWDEMLHELASLEKKLGSVSVEARNKALERMALVHKSVWGPYSAC